MLADLIWYRMGITAVSTNLRIDWPFDCNVVVDKIFDCVKPILFNSQPFDFPIFPFSFVNYHMSYLFEKLSDRGEHEMLISYWQRTYCMTEKN